MFRPLRRLFLKPERSKEKKPGKGFAVQGSQTRPYLQADSHSLEKIEETLAYCRGNKTQAAQMLGLSTRQLYYRLEKLKEQTFAGLIRSRRQGSLALPRHRASLVVNSLE